MKGPDLGRLLRAPWSLLRRGRPRGDSSSGDGQGPAKPLADLVAHHHPDGLLTEVELRMVRGVLRLAGRTAREIMVPRVDIAALSVDASLQDLVKLIEEEQYSRIPLYKNNLDNIVGVVYSKGLIKELSADVPPKLLIDTAPKPHFVPQTKPIDALLREFQEKRVHLAIVVDEYGGTAGLVSMEDLLEEIVGDIEDEYDVATRHIERISELEAVVDGLTSLSDVNAALGLELEADGFDTIGGLVQHMLGKVPITGDVVETIGVRVRVLSTLGRRVKTLRITKLPPPEPPAS